MYATKQDIIDLYGEELLYVLADRDRDQVLDEAAISKALAFAQGQINTYLGKRHSLAEIAASADVKRLAVNLAVYTLALSADALTNEITKRYDDSIKQMELMARGVIGLGITDAQPAQPASEVLGGDPLVTNNERIFTRQSQKGL